MERAVLDVRSRELAEVCALLAADPGNGALRRRERALRQELVGEVPAGVILRWREGWVHGMSLSILRGTEGVLSWVRSFWGSAASERVSEVEVGRCAELPTVLSALSDIPRGVSVLRLHVWRKGRQEIPQSIEVFPDLRGHPGLTEVSIWAESMAPALLEGLPVLRRVSIGVLSGSKEDFRRYILSDVEFVFHSGEGFEMDEEEDPGRG